MSKMKDAPESSAEEAPDGDGRDIEARAVKIWNTRSKADDNKPAHYELTVRDKATGHAGQFSTSDARVLQVAIQRLTEGRYDSSLELVCATADGEVMLLQWTDVTTPADETPQRVLTGFGTEAEVNNG